MLGPGRYEGDPALGLVTNDGDSRELSWRLTPAGEEYVRDHRSDLEPPQDAVEAVEVSRQAREDVAELESRIQSVAGKHGQLKQRFEKAESRNRDDRREIQYSQGKLRERVSALENRLDKFEGRLSNIEDILQRREPEQ